MLLALRLGLAHPNPYGKVHVVIDSGKDLRGIGVARAHFEWLEDAENDLKVAKETLCILAAYN